MHTTTPQGATEMTNITRPHCQACGSTAPEDIRDLRDTEGYTRCCNERVVDPSPDLFGRTTTCGQRRDCCHD